MVSRQAVDWKVHALQAFPHTDIALGTGVVNQISRGQNYICSAELIFNQTEYFV